MFSSLLLLASLAPQIPAQPTEVLFECTCKDALSQHYASHMRHLLSFSERLKAVKDPSGIHWKLAVVAAVVQGEANDPDLIAISAAITYDGSLIKQTADACGKAEINRCATDSIASLEQAVMNISR
jgi:hypothetical protein